MVRTNEWLHDEATERSSEPDEGGGLLRESQRQEVRGPKPALIVSSRLSRADQITYAISTVHASWAPANPIVRPMRLGVERWSFSSPPSAVVSTSFTSSSSS
jgi:hypothetical protein